jgi:steroid delta-isomerase-like uncharacterized protein
MGQLDRFARDVFDALNRGDLDAVGARLDPECDFAAPGFAARGGEAVVGWMSPFLAAFPGIHHEVLDVVEGDGAVAVEIRIAGTHTAPLAGPGGAIPPTGREISFDAANVWRVRDGRITEYRIYFDQMGFMGQLGLIPGAPAAANA